MATEKSNSKPPVPVTARLTRTVERREKRAERVEKTIAEKC